MLQFSRPIQIGMLVLLTKATLPQAFIHSPFRPTSNAVATTNTFSSSSSPSLLRMVIEVGPPDQQDVDDEDGETPPGQMKLSEIKSELSLRRISYTDCFDRESLESRLNEARASGKADPTIIDEFNRRNEEANTKGETFSVSEDVLDEAVGGDGTLPGGMPPEMLMEMMKDEELVGMLRSSKMQEVMKMVMTGGQEALEEAMKTDQETYECVQKLNQVMGNLNKN